MAKKSGSKKLSSPWELYEMKDDINNLHCWQAPSLPARDSDRTSPETVVSPWLSLPDTSSDQRWRRGQASWHRPGVIQIWEEVQGLFFKRGIFYLIKMLCLDDLPRKIKVVYSGKCLHMVSKFSLLWNPCSLSNLQYTVLGDRLRSWLLQIWQNYVEWERSL